MKDGLCFAYQYLNLLFKPTTKIKIKAIEFKKRERPIHVKMYFVASMSNEFNIPTTEFS